MISKELSKLVDDTLQKFLDKQKLTCKYKYNEMEKGMFISGFVEGFTIGRTMSNPELKSKSKKELKKKL